MAICWQIRRQNLIPRFTSSQSVPGSQRRAEDEGRTGEGRGKISCPCLLNFSRGGRIHGCSRAHMHVESIEEIGLEPQLLLLHFPTLRTRRLTLFGCKRRGFVIYNQFSALVSPTLTCPFCSFYPAPKALTAFLRCTRSPLPLSLSFLPLSPSSSLPALQRPV